MGYGLLVIGCWGLVIGPLSPAPAHPDIPLRGGMNFRLRGGIGYWLLVRNRS